MELTRFDPEVLTCPGVKIPEARAHNESALFLLALWTTECLSGKCLQKDTYMSRYVVANLHKNQGIFAFVRLTTYSGGITGRHLG